MRSVKGWGRSVASQHGSGWRRQHAPTRPKELARATCALEPLRAPAFCAENADTDLRRSERGDCNRERIASPPSAMGWGDLPSIRNRCALCLFPQTLLSARVEQAVDMAVRPYYYRVDFVLSLLIALFH